MDESKQREMLIIPKDFSTARKQKENKNRVPESGNRR